MTIDERYEIRGLTSDDADELAQLHVTIWRDTYTGLIPQEKLDGLGEGLSEKLGKLGAVVAGASVGDWLLDAIGKASDLNETVSKSQAIFEGQANSVRQWSQGAAQSMGLSSQAALDAATSFGDMFRQLGDSGPMAAQTSQQVVQLAADLGSFNNLETGDVIDIYEAAGMPKPSLSQLGPEFVAMNHTHGSSRSAAAARPGEYVENFKCLPSPPINLVVQPRGR